MSYADQGEQFLQYFVTGDKMWINCAAPKTKKASMHYLLQQKNSEQCDQ